MKFLTFIKQIIQFTSAFAAKLALLNWLRYIYCTVYLPQKLWTAPFQTIFLSLMLVSEVAAGEAPPVLGEQQNFLFDPRVWFALLAARPHCWLTPVQSAAHQYPQTPFLGALSCAGPVKPYEMSDWSKSSLLLCPGVAACPGCQWSFVHLWIVPWPWRRIVPVLSPWIAVRGCTQPFHQPTWPQADASSMQTLVTSAGLCHFEFCSQCLFWSVLSLLYQNNSRIKLFSNCNVLVLSR